MVQTFNKVIKDIQRALEFGEGTDLMSLGSDKAMFHLEMIFQ